jgi:CheY-like chemotaxis protein
MKNVLLVDDDKLFNFLSSKILERLGMTNEIHAALNGQEAITLFNNYYQGKDTLPDIILLDLNMPVMDGFSFLEAFKKLNIPHKEKVKIIIVTSSIDPTDAKRAQAMGVYKYLRKPITDEDLRTALED